MLYKPNYLDSLIAACGAIGRAMKTILKPSLTVQPLTATSFYYNISLSFEITSSVLSMKVLLELNSSAEALVSFALCA